MVEEYNAKWLKSAEDVSRKAGEYLRQGLERSRQINFQDDRDVKLQADLDSEHLIRKVLKEETGLPVIGEEEGGDASLLETDQFFWVVDPLDGTYNYLRNQPETCVSIGLMQGRRFISGVIYDFNRDELLSGGVNEGIAINGKKIQVSWPETVGQSCIMTGFPGRRDFSSEALQQFIDQVQRFKKVRMIGSAALALATVASGRADAYYEESICLWDIAAGAALIKAAGGHIRIASKSTENPFIFNFWAVGRKDWFPEAS